MGTTQSTHHRSRSAFARSQRSNGLDGCLGCFPNPDKPDPNVDNAELQTHNRELIPKGKVSKASIAYLTKDEIGFLKACSGKNVSALRFYMNKGINVNLLDEDRTSPLHIASRSGSLQVVEELINWGAAVNIADMAGWTSLHIAAFYQRSFVCHLLLKKGADPYLMSRNGETPWDFVKEKNTEEVFYVHIDRADLKKMGKNRKEEPPGEIDDENILIHKVGIGDVSFENRIGKLGIGLRMGGNVAEEEKVVDRSYILSIRGTEDIQNNSLVRMSCNLDRGYQPPKKGRASNQGKRIESKVSQTMRKENTDRRESEIRSMRQGGKMSLISLTKDEEGLEISQAPKKHKYYSHFRKIKAMHMTNFHENKDVLCTLESEDSGVNDVSHYSFHDGSNMGDQSYQRPVMTEANKTMDLIQQDPNTNKLKSSGVTDSLYPQGKPPLLNPQKSKEIVPPLSSQILNKKGNLPAYRPQKQFHGHQQYFDDQQLQQSLQQSQMQQSQQHRHSRDNSMHIIPTRRSSAVSCVEKTTLSAVSFLQTAPPLSIFRLIVKENKELMSNSFMKNNGTNPTEVDHLVDLTPFKIEPKFTKALYNLGVHIFNSENISGLSFMFLFKLLRQSSRDIALFLHKNDTLEAIKKSPYQVTQILSNPHLKESLDILYHYSGFFQFEGMTFLEALRSFFSGFLLENDPERIDWLLRGFTKRYYTTVKKFDQPIRAIRAAEARTKETFETPEAVYMLAFATVMLDIELNHTKEGDWSVEGRRQEPAVKGEFYLSLAYVNGGENFSKGLIDHIFDEVKKRKVVKLVGTEEPGRSDKPMKKLFENAKVSVKAKKESKKNKKIVKEYILWFEGPMCCVLKVMGESSQLIGVFMTKGCKVERTREKKMRFKRVNGEKEGIAYARFKPAGELAVSAKQEMEFIVEKQDEIVKVQRYLETVKV